MNRNAETMANVIVAIDDILTAYLEPSDQPRDANATLELIMLTIDRADALGAAQRTLAGFTGPKLVR